MNRRNFIHPTALRGAAMVGAGTTAGQREDRDPRAIHASTLVVDGLNATQLDEQRVRLLRQGGVNCAVKGVGGVSGFARMRKFLDTHASDVARATTVREIRQLHQQGKIAIVLEWQSADPVAQGSQPPPNGLRAYYELGLRIVGIAYNVANVFGGGSLEPTVGLTKAGRRLVDEIHKLRIVLDVGGHTGEQTGFDAIEMSTGVPVICTHTNVRALNDNPRCMTDRLIEAIAKTGGMVGITAFNDFMARSRKDPFVRRTPQVGLDKYLDQFDYVKKLVGVDHVGVGADNTEGVAGGNALNPILMDPVAYSEQPWFYVKGFETIAEMPNVTKGLVDRGWPVADIRKVLGENWLRVYEKVWGA